jgi:hypothetical protein
VSRLPGYQAHSLACTYPAFLFDDSGIIKYAEDRNKGLAPSEEMTRWKPATH